MQVKIKVLLTLLVSILSFFFIRSGLTYYIVTNYPHLMEKINDNDKSVNHYTESTGIGSGYNGDVTVKVFFDGDNISEIKVVKHQEDIDWYMKAKKGVIPAIIDTQSTNVDVVAGATYSSKAIIEGVKNAMEGRK